MRMGSRESVYAKFNLKKTFKSRAERSVSFPKCAFLFIFHVMIDQKDITTSSSCIESADADADERVSS